MIYSAIFSLLITFSIFTLPAQTLQIQASHNLPEHKIRGIQIGEAVPDVLMDKMVHVDGSVKSAHLSDYKDRLLILDFMYTSCTSCLIGLVKKNQLQEQFGDQIKVLAVVGGEYFAPGMLKRENEAFIKTYLTSKNYLNFHQVKIPWVVENKKLNTYFPHVNVSHLVWIYKGKLVAVTEQDYVTKDNIQQVLDGKPNDWPVKNDFLPPVDIITPLVNQPATRFNRQIAKNDHAAAFGTYQDGYYTKHGSVKDSLHQIRRDYHINIPIVNLYRMYWLKTSRGKELGANLQPTQLILEVKDRELYVVQEDSRQYNYVSRQKTLVSVEINSLDTGQTEEKHAGHIIKELNNLLGMEGRYETRKMKCLVLYQQDKSEKFKAKSQVRKAFRNSDTVAPNIRFEQNRMEDLVFKMNQFYGNPPVFDETNYTGFIDMKFSIDSWTNIPAVRKALNGYGLDLRAEERDLEVFVLTEH